MKEFMNNRRDFLRKVVGFSMGVSSVGIVELIAVDNSSVILKLVVIAGNKGRDALDKQIKKSEYNKKGFKHSILSRSDFDSLKSKSALFVLYDPENIEGKLR